ncbi:MAG: peptidylprolyl isomerase [Desulfobacterota bacterium]|nr:peptidylprolyl isomerase [Thermodesulfobacteriota bacterium]
MATQVRKGDTISVHYTGRFEDGSIFDSSLGRSPLVFTVGAGQIIKGFDDAVIGMVKGEKKTVSIKPDMAYGQRSEELVFDFPRSNVPDGMELEVGMMVQLRDDEGNPVPAVIAAINDTFVTMDCNHPLAGKTLEFDIQIIETGLTPDVSCSGGTCGSCAGCDN